MSNGTGVVSSAAVTSIAVVCVGPYSVGGTISGLAPDSSLVLTNNGAYADTISSNGPFSFASALKPGSSYAVAIATQPALQVCTLGNGSGTLSAAVTSISVTCVGPFSVGGQVSGLSSGASLSITNNGADALTVTVNGSFTFHTALKPGSSFLAAISQLPADEQCGLTGGSGTVATSNYTAIAIACAIPTLSLVAGGLGGSGSIDGNRNTARLYNPTDVVADSSGNLYVADDYNTLIRKVDVAGNVTTLAGKARQMGTADGTGAAARFYAPVFMSLSSVGNLLVADSGANTIRQVTPAGVVTTIAGAPPQAGSLDGASSIARFDNPEVLAADPSGNLYVGDANGIREVTPAGQVTTAFSQGSLSGLATDGKGNLYFSRIPNNSIQRIAADGTVSLVAGSQNAGFGDGTGAAAGFNQPHGLAVDSKGDIFVADTLNATIRMFTPAGVVTTIAGSSGVKGSADGTGPAASFIAPFGIAVDSNDLLFVTDGNAIRTVTAGGVVTTLAGSQTYGSSDGTGPAAQFNSPNGIAIGPNGAIFVTDGGNSTVRKISVAGVVTTLAGIAGEAGVKLGPLPTTLNVPVGLAYVGSTLYVEDAGENSILAISGVF